MYVQAIQTHLIQQGESWKTILDSYVSTLPECSILAVTSKILSLCQGRVVPKTEISKKALLRQEADAILEGEESPYDLTLTLKNNILIPSAGIDESNGQGTYVLYPEDIQGLAVEIWKYLREKHALNHCGVIITDSHTTPLRRGVTGIALGWCGFNPLRSYIGTEDLFGDPLRVTQSNLLDGLAAAAVLVMGEGNECTPLALIKEGPPLCFFDRPPTRAEQKNISISIEEDLYRPFLKAGNWIYKTERSDG